MWIAVERGLARSPGVPESSSAYDHGLSTYFDDEIDKLTRQKAALRSGLAELVAWHGFDKGLARQK